MTSIATADELDRPSGLSMADASAVTDTSPDTLRYYERAGVMPAIARTSGGQRSYTTEDLGWITFVRRLRSTGMTMQRIAEYTAMVRTGEGTIAERRRFIEEHRATVAAAIGELHDVLEVLDRKIEHYEAAEQGIGLECSDVPLRHANLLS
mgnify:FL=1